MRSVYNKIIHSSCMAGNPSTAEFGHQALTEAKELVKQTEEEKLAQNDGMIDVEKNSAKFNLMNRQSVDEYIRKEMDKVASVSTLSENFKILLEQFHRLLVIDDALDNELAVSVRKMKELEELLKEQSSWAKIKKCLAGITSLGDLRQKAKQLSLLQCGRRKDE